MNTLTKLCLGTALAMAFAQPGAAQDKTGQAPDQADASAKAAAPLAPDTVVAVVNGEKITVGDMAVARASLGKQYDQVPPDVLYNALRDRLIRQVLLVQSMKDIPPELHYLIQNQTRSLIASQAATRIADAAVTEDDIKAAYQKDYVDAPPVKEYDASHILFKEDDKAGAEAAVKRAKAGEDFAGLARELSTGPTGPNGGELGWFSADQMVQPFSEAVSKMKPGDIAGPVHTQFGWHVIKLNDVRQKEKTVPKLEDVRADIEKKLRLQAAQTAVEGMEAAADIQKTPGLDQATVLDGSVFPIGADAPVK